MNKYAIALTANGKNIELSGFPRDFVIQVTLGAASSLKGVEDIAKLELTLKFGKVKLAINGRPVSLKPFPTLIIAKTLIGLVSTLKGVEEEVTAIEIKMD